MQIHARDIKCALNSGSAYLRQRLFSGRYGLECIGLDGKPKFSNDKGHLFSTFYLVNALKGSLTEIERTIFLTRIFSEECIGEWGYSPRGYYKESGHNPFFVDADDSSFALRTLRALGIYRSNEILLNYKSSFMHLGAKLPAFMTFRADPTEKKIVTEGSFKNNLQLHPEVNANIYHCLIDTPHDNLISEELIISSQKGNGSWASFFYPDPYYATLLFMSLLKKTGTLTNCYNKGRKYIQDAQNVNGSWGPDNEYFSAMALKALCLDNVLTEDILKGVYYIIGSMAADGSWKTPHPIWEFHDNDGDIWRAYDSNHIIATSLCVEVLNIILEMIDHKS